MPNKWHDKLQADAYDFAPDILRLQHQPPSPMPRAILWSLLALLFCLMLWTIFGKLDIIAVAQGKLVPQSSLKIVQPAEAGIVKEIHPFHLTQDLREGGRLGPSDLFLGDDRHVRWREIEVFRRARKTGGGYENLSQFHNRVKRGCNQLPDRLFNRRFTLILPFLWVACLQSL